MGKPGSGVDLVGSASATCVLQGQACTRSHSFPVCKPKLLRSAAQKVGWEEVCAELLPSRSTRSVARAACLAASVKSQQSRLALQCSGGGAASPGAVSVG